MKKITSILITVCLAITMVACGKTEGQGTKKTESQMSESQAVEKTTIDDATSAAAGIEKLTPEELAEKYTAEKLVEITAVGEMIDAQGAFSVTEQFVSEEKPYMKTVYAKNKEGFYELSSRSESWGGSYYLSCYCSDASDPYMYGYDGDSTEKVYVDQETADYLLGSLWEFSIESTKIDAVKQDENEIVINATNKNSFGSEDTFVITIEASTGRITKCIERDMVIYEFAYDSSFVVDHTAKEKYESGSVDAPDIAFDPKTDPLVFDTVDVNGNKVTEKVFQGATLVILNFFDPSDRTNMGVMGELEKLYQGHKDQGLIVIGVYSATDDEDTVKNALESREITFPVVKSDDHLKFYEQTFTPAAFLLDGNGKLLTDEVFAGVRLLSTWENDIAEYLE